jgi:thioredoxin 1
MKNLLMVIAFFLLAGCGKQQSDKNTIPSLQTYASVTSRIQSSGDTLLVFDLYADWCGPCRMLAPTLESLSETNKAKARFYRINVDMVPEAAQAFGVTGIPLIVFVKNTKQVGSLVGLQPAGEYQKMIDANQ